MIRQLTVDTVFFAGVVSRLLAARLVTFFMGEGPARRLIVYIVIDDRHANAMHLPSYPLSRSPTAKPRECNLSPLSQKPSIS